MSYIEEFDKQLKEEEKYYQEHPVKGFFRDIGIFLWYRLPTIISEYRYEVKWGFQRMFRGYDDPMLWSYPHQNANITLKVLKNLQKNKMGYPIIDDEDILPDNSVYPAAKRKWDIALGKMARGFEAFIKEDDVRILDDNGKYDSVASQKERDRLMKLWEEGSAIYIRYYSNLWD